MGTQDQPAWRITEWTLRSTTAPVNTTAS